MAKMIPMGGKGTDGTAKGIRVSNRGVVGATDLIGSNINIDTHTATMTAGQTITLLDTTSPLIVEDIDWLARHETDAQILIEIKGGGNSFINGDGTDAVTWISPRELLNNKSLLFDIVQYDTTVTPAPKFRFHLKKPIYCPTGIRVTLRNNSTDQSFRNSCQVRGRVYLDD